MRDNTESTTPDSPRKRPSLRQVIVSVLGGALGVQSSKQREADFQSTSPWPYIIAGLLFTLLFIGILIVIVSWVVGDLP
ncbi:MAG: DUF2970 domain-containing protein, partial [Gammaproteobacteria bacterium]|nr:DUF2970 domain-containing protein [Gammaproteobacteria bacterium]